MAATVQGSKGFQHQRSFRRRTLRVNSCGESFLYSTPVRETVTENADGAPTCGSCWSMAAFGDS